MSAERTAIDDATIADIKSRVRLSEFIGRTVKLKRVGGEFVGLSPFKDERTPSFTVNDDKGFYHCFSSGKHGDIIEWVTETQGLNFRQAIDLLASETGTSVASAPAPTKVKSAPLVPICHYEYQDETGFPYMRVTRFEPKTFRQFHWDCDGWANGKPKTGVIPYRLPEIVARPNDDIWLVEGEKDADTLASLGLLATTAPGGATAFPRDDMGFLKWFDGRRVYAIPDNDEAGAKWRERVAHGIADVKFLHLSGPKDVTDYVNAGHDIADLVRLCDVDFDALDAFEPVAPSSPAAPEQEPKAPSITPTKFEWCDPSTIPPREWVYDTHLIRKFVSLTVSPGGLGKSSLALVEALSLVVGRPLLADAKTHEGPLRVWYWNGEDPQEETKRRVMAAAKHYRLSADDLGGRLFTDSGRDTPLVLGHNDRDGITLNEDLFERIETTMIEHGIDVFIADPFVSAHRLGENDNNAIDALIKRLGRVADKTNTAIEIVHHVRKPNSTQAETYVNDARGASALIGGVRSARVLNVMSEDVATSGGVPQDLRMRHFSVSDGKANMSPKAGEARWRFLESINLENKTADRESDNVGVVTYYELPKEAKQMHDLSRSEDEMRLILSTDDTVRHWDGKGRGRKPKNWLGHRILDALQIHGGEHDAAMQRLITGWIKDGTIVTRAAWADGNRNTFLTLPGAVFEAGPQHHTTDDDAPF